MPDIITSPVAIQFCNQKVRPICNYIASIDVTISSILNEWNAGGYSALFPNDATSVVQDTSVTPAPGDGRNPIDGANVQAVITFLQTVQTALAANSNADRNIVNICAVNVSTLC